MLLSISGVNHPYLPHYGLSVENSDETIRKLLAVTTVPNTDILDLKAFDIVQHVKKLFADREEAFNKREEEMKEWQKKFDALTEEQREKYRTEGLLEGLEPKPMVIEKYSGVLIGEDVPLYLMGFLSGYLWRESIKIYFNYHIEETVIDSYEETEITGVLTPLEKPSGKKMHRIFLLSDVPLK